MTECSKIEQMGHWFTNLQKKRKVDAINEARQCEQKKRHCTHFKIDST